MTDELRTLSEVLTELTTSGRREQTVALFAESVGRVVSHEWAALNWDDGAVEMLVIGWDAGRDPNWSSLRRYYTVIETESVLGKLLAGWYYFNALEVDDDVPAISTYSNDREGKNEVK